MKKIFVLKIVFILFFPLFAFGYQKKIPYHDDLSSLTQYNDFKINDFNVDIDVKENGVAFIKETLSITFKRPRHGIIRYIPYVYKGENKFLGNKYLKISDVNVFKLDNDLNAKERFSIINGKNKKHIKIGNPKFLVRDEQTYIIEYKATGAIKKDEHEDLFSWNLTGNEWDTSILNTRATISFPENIFNQNKSISFYTGYFGSNEQLNNFKIQDNKIIFNSNKILEPEQGISFFISFPKNTFLPYPKDYYVDLIIFKIKEFWFLILGALLSVFSLIVWLIYGKDVYTPTPPQYEAPNDLDPISFRFLLKERLASSDNVSPIIFYLADKGFLKIKKTKEGDFILEKTKDDFSSLKDYECFIMNRIFFGTKAQTSLNNFRVTPDFFESIKIKVKNFIKKQDFFHSSSFYFQEIILFLLVLFSFLGFFYTFTSGSPGFSIVALFLFMISIYPFYKHMLKKTRKGNEVYAKCKGYELFLKKIDIPQIKVLMQDDPSFFSKALPFAMVCGFTNDFLSKFENLILNAPSWYEQEGSTTFYPRDFSRINRALDKSLTPPAPKNNSGRFGNDTISFGGGSFGGSGGGFGGGGGSSW